MKTPDGGTGETRLSLSSPVWVMQWGSEMSGGSHTSATGMEEVTILIDSVCYIHNIISDRWKHWISKTRNGNNTAFFINEMLCC